MADGGDITIIGGGLAGCEAAWQAAERGCRVCLYEMRPDVQTPAHRTGHLAELVCSNSLGSSLPDRGSGLLQEELARLGSLLVTLARDQSLPAGGALAVDRDRFAATVTAELERHERISIVRREVCELPAEGVTIIASGPLTSGALAQALQELLGEEWLYFFDAMAPIVDVDSIDMSICFRASRYDRGETPGGDYINCPLNEEEYYRFVDELCRAERIPLHDFETSDPHFFEGCLPLEELARRGRDTLAFGPLRPVGLRDPRTGNRPYAVVQLRQDDTAGRLYNLVGFQTNLRWSEQSRILRLIPGLGQAEFVRFGQMHRNAFINAPHHLSTTLQLRADPRLFFAGQIAGVEGYLGSVACGWLAGVNAARTVQGQEPFTLPAASMSGALLGYIATADAGKFQPMKANFGLLPSLPTRIRSKRERYMAMAACALEAMDDFVKSGGTLAMLEISRTVSIPDDEIELSAIRAQGTGGQNVNKVSSAIHLRFDIHASSLPDSYKERLLVLRDQRISKDGVVVIKAQQFRTQEKNRQNALDRLQKLIERALVVQKARRPTRATKGSQERRIKSKVQRGKTKALRGRVGEQ